MTAKEGYLEIVQNNTDLKCVEAYEGKDFYLYYIIPADCDPKDYIGGPFLYGIEKKTKKIFQFNYIEGFEQLSKTKKVSV